MRSALVTGGSGSFGRAFVRRLLRERLAERIAVYSRSEALQADMRAALYSEFGAELADERVRYFIGDVRDIRRLRLAMRGVDAVVHAAALKRVDDGEYNPSEFIATNVHGALNVIEAAHEAGVSKVLALSTDKASQPVNLYGASKLCAEKLFVAANSQYGGPAYSCVRYGNVAASRGSVIPLWQKLAAEGKPLPITDVRMSRYWMLLDDAVDLVLRSLKRMKGGEVFIPKLASFKVTELAEAIAPRGKDRIVGLRPGEKLHESLIGADEAHTAYDLGDDYALIPPASVLFRAPEHPGMTKVPDGFTYTSGTNDRWLDAPELRRRLAALDGERREAA